VPCGSVVQDDGLALHLAGWTHLWCYVSGRVFLEFQMGSCAALAQGAGRSYLEPDSSVKFRFATARYGQVQHNGSR
jgi:hypothetical protein